MLSFILSSGTISNTETTIFPTYSLLDTQKQNYQKFGLFYGLCDILPELGSFFVRLWYNTYKEVIGLLRERMKSWLRKEQEKLAPMSAKKRWEYLWTYYKWWFLSCILFIWLVVFSVQNYQYQNKEVLLSGIFINTSTSAEGYAYVKEGYWAYNGADQNTRVELIEARSIRFHTEQPTETDVNLIMSVDTMIAAAELDYIIGDTSALEFYDQQGSLLDLSSVLTQAQLSRFDVVTTETGVVGIDLTGSDLHRQFGLYSEPSYLMILVNTPHQEQCSDFIQYLLSE